MIDKILERFPSAKLIGTKDYYADCPKCNHHKSKVSIDKDTTVYQCLVCGYKGRIIGEEPLTTKDYLIYKRRLTSELINKLEAEGVLEFGNNDIKIYFDENKIDHQQKVLYPDKAYFTKGKGRVFCYPVNTEEFKQRRGVIIAEGFEDAMSLYLAKPDHAVIALTGLNKFNSAMSFIREFSEQKKPIYLCLDNEEGGTPAATAVDKVISFATRCFPSTQVLSLREYGVKDANELLQKRGLEDLKKIFPTKVSLFKSISDSFDSFAEYINDDIKVRGTPTTIDGIDDALGGGERLGEIDALIAEAKSGKSSLFAQLIYHRLELGMPVGYIQRELLPESDLIPNLLSIHFKENYFKKGKLTQEELEGARRVLEGWKLSVPKGLGRISISDIRDYMIDALDKHGTRHFYLDHFHRCLKESENKDEIAEFIKELALLVRELQVHLWLIVQPTKPNLMSGSGLTMNSMRGSVALSQEVDNIWILQRVQGQKWVNNLKLTAARHKLCVLDSSIMLQYNTEDTSVSEVTLEPDVNKKALDD